jgi:hypothetical protein
MIVNLIPIVWFWGHDIFFDVFLVLWRNLENETNLKLTKHLQIERQGRRRGGPTA